MTLVSVRNALEYRSPTTPSHVLGAPFAQDGATSSSLKQKTQAGREWVSWVSCPHTRLWGLRLRGAGLALLTPCSPCVLGSLPNLSGPGLLPHFLSGERTFLLHLVRQK